MPVAFPHLWSDSPNGSVGYPWPLREKIIVSAKHSMNCNCVEQKVGYPTTPLGLRLSRYTGSRQAEVRFLNVGEKWVQ